MTLDSRVCCFPLTTCSTLANDLAMSGFDVDNGSAEMELCYNSTFDSLPFKRAAILRASMGMFSFLFCGCVILLSICFKKYYFFTQRLVLYLTIAAMLHSLSYTVGRVNFHSSRLIKDPYCYFAGLLELYTSWIELLSICCIVFNLFSATVMTKIREAKYLECVYLVVTFLLPLLWCWIPFVEEAYGSAGPWCGIRVLTENCSPFRFGRVLRFVLWHVPAYTIFLFILVTSIMIMIKVRRDIRKWDGTPYNSATKINKQMIKDEVRPLLWYPLIYLILRSTFLISEIYDTVHPQTPRVALWNLQVVTSPLAGTVIALMYAFDSETRAHLKLCGHSLMAACPVLWGDKPSKSCRKDVRDYEIECHSQYGDSIEGTQARRHGCAYHLQVSQC